MTRDEVRKLQQDLNEFTNRYLDDVTPLRVDGEMGPATERRVKAAKWYLGYPRAERNAPADHSFRVRLRHPKGLRYTNPKQVALGNQHRVAQRRGSRKNKKAAASSTGVGTFDGKPCANWLIPYLRWARSNGWDGKLVSGWRDPAYSEKVCKEMCGRPSCPGRCAGRSSNHSGSAKPAGALDVSHYDDFGRVIARCPLQPKLRNVLGPADPVHYSASGR